MLISNNAVTSNTSNFYALAASNCLEKLLWYISAMAQPAIPREIYLSLGPFTELAGWRLQDRIIMIRPRAGRSSGLTRIMNTRYAARLKRVLKSLT